jgi:glycosyltransferase involved in cell wall biosynthesis
MARVVIAGTFDPEYSRNRWLRVLLGRAGHTVVLCQVDVWGGDLYEIPGKRRGAVAARAARLYPRLLWRFLRQERPDAVLFVYPGWFDVLLLAPLAKLRRIPVVFDIFVSLYDTLVTDRKLARASSKLARISRVVDRLSVRFADLLLADTPQHGSFYVDSLRARPNRIGIVHVGAQDDVFHASGTSEPIERRVLFYGSYIGLQGVDTIVRAAKQLEDEDVTFRLIGSGQEKPAIDELVEELRPTNVELIPAVPLTSLPGEIEAATLCLGIFGISDKARRVIPNKLYECIAVGRPVITGDTPAVRASFSDDELEFVPLGDPTALAAAVRRLLADPDRRESIARAAHARYAAEFSAEPLSRALDYQLHRVLRNRRAK